MGKQSFLVVSLREGRAKKLAQVLANDTSLKILDYLANKDATESELANELSVPISTIHYNLKILVDSRMIKSDEYHYSDKGKVMNHYTLANKYILISPGKEVGLKEKLKAAFPLSIILLAMAGAIDIATNPNSLVRNLAKSAQADTVAAGGEAAARTLMTAAAPIAAQESSEPNIALWFLIGAFSAMGLYLLLRWLKDRE